MHACFTYHEYVLMLMSSKERIGTDGMEVRAELEAEPIQFKLSEQFTCSVLLGASGFRPP